MSDLNGAGQASARLLSLQTALGLDVLQPVSFEAEEAISTPYSVTVEAVSDEASIDPDAVLYQPACLKIFYGTGDARIMQGIVRSFVATGEPQRGRFSYTLTFVPKLWFMRQTIDCRIFTTKSVADILTAICSDVGQTLNISVYGEKTPLPYVTQFNEDDFTFLSRLIEGAGYFYFFSHTEGDHTLVISDTNQGFPASPSPSLPVVEAGGGTDVLTSWHKVGGTVHGKQVVRDYDPLNPSTLPEATQTTTLKTSGASTRDVFEWPGLAVTQADATGRARIKMEAAEAEAALFEALCANPAFLPGARFKLSRDPFDDSQGTEYVIRSVTSSGHDHTWLGGDAAPEYRNRIVAFKAAVTWREKLATPRPAMTGLHSAVVLGNSGEEIHTDTYGRIKVRFFWDHREDATADTACWVRVIQPWSGNTWGWQHLPRVGTEVAVAFLDGDPDRPVAVGGLYNAEMMPPFTLPADQTKSGLRTRSTTEGSTSNISELSFDDKKGSELVFLHAEKDMTVEIENDRTETIDHNETITVKNDQSITVNNNRSLTVKQQETIEVDDSQTITVKNGRTTTVNASGDTLTVKDGGITTTASNSDISIKASLGNITLEAMNSITLKVGENTIKIDNTGVTVTATQVKVQGQAMVQIQGPMTQVSADGMLTLKGGVMMLN